MKAKPPTCNCPPSSPFRWAERSAATQAPEPTAKPRKAAIKAPDQDKADRARKLTEQVLKVARSGISIAPRGDGERSRKLRMTGI